MSMRKCFICLCCLFFSTQVFAAKLAGPFTTKDGRIIDQINQSVSLQGVSWFGFNTSNHVLHGLWTADFDTMLKQIKSLHFNAVRIPIQFDFVEDVTIKPDSISTSCNGGQSCNLDVPQDSALHTLQWVVQQFTDNGILVLLDDHYEDNTFENDPKRWLQDWQTLAKLFKTNPLVAYDLLNEPDSHQITWDTNSNAPALGENYLAAANAIYAIDPHKLIFIEGTGQGQLESNWGNGFATDDETIKANISNPKNFFNQLISQPIVNQIVISPHIYGPDGTNGDGPDESNLQHATQVWTRLFGYLNTKGFCNKSCHLFPIALGEFGGKFDPADPWYQTDVVIQNNIGNFFSGLSNENWFYWDWNPNSGNTGGILKDDWKTIDQNKVTFLQTKMGLSQ